MKREEIIVNITCDWEEIILSGEVIISEIHYKTNKGTEFVSDESFAIGDIVEVNICGNTQNSKE